MIQQILDDPNATLWTAPNLDILTGVVLDELFSDILDVAPYYNSFYQQFALPLHPPGFIDLRTVADGGDLTNRMYRIQQVIADGRQYFPKDPRDYLMSATSNTGDVTTIKADTGVEQRFSYQFLGQQLWLHPLGQVTTFVELRYSYRPARWDTNADNVTTDTIGLPDGHEDALIYVTAARAMAKGNREDVSQIREDAEAARQRLMNFIRRRYHGMMQPFTTDNSWSFGGI